jgi:hypothetical protein
MLQNTITKIGVKRSLHLRNPATCRPTRGKRRMQRKFRDTEFQKCLRQIFKNFAATLDGEERLSQHEKAWSSAHSMNDRKIQQLMLD